MKKYFVFITSLALSACGGVDPAEYQSDIPALPPTEEKVVDSARSETQQEPTFELVDEAEASEIEVFKNPEEETLETPEEILNEELVALPAQLNLAVPFYSQAPDGDWSQPWQDACEEASILQAHYGLSGQPLSKDEFRQMVLEMVEWQNDVFGYYESTTVDQVVQLYQGFFEDPFEIKVIDEPTVDDLKAELAQNHLIVAPFAGQHLGNPFYSGEGPYYHMLVIKGYDQSHFITNDVGTRHGADFIFSYDAIMNALHDYDPENITAQPARVIVLSP